MSSSISGIGSAQQSALGGIRGQIERFNKAATDVVRFGAQHGAAAVEISDAARAQLSQQPGGAPVGQPLGADLEGALLETHEASASLTADVRVLQTTNDMSKELMNMFGRR